MSVRTEDQLIDCREYFEEEHLQEYLERVTNILGISSPRYSIKLGSRKGDNYVSVIYRVYIQGNKNGVPTETQTIFKVPPKVEFNRQAPHIDYFFSREHLFYTELVPIFKDFLRTKNKSLENVARCYFSSIDHRKEAFGFEDLRPKGFVMRDRIKQMDFAHASLAFRALGRLHGLSFALRDQKPELFRSKIATLKEIAFSPEFIATESVITSYRMLGNLVKTALAEENPRYTERFSQFFKDIFGHAERSCDGSLAEPYAVLGHGDYWMNNMLFKYEENSTEPQSIYLVDFQFVRYVSPAADLSFALFSSCSQDLRDRHYDELIKIYHDSLSGYLSELGSDPKKLFPYEALLDQLDNFAIHSACIALLAIPLLVSQDNDIPNVLNNNCDLARVDERVQKDGFLKHTLRDTYKDLIDRNYI